MIVACPTCATCYEAPAGWFPPEGRAVRCAGCGHDWRVAPALVEGEAVEVAGAQGGKVVAGATETDGEAERLLRAAREAAAVHAQRRARQASALRGSLGAGLAVLLFLATGIALRSEIVRLLPGAAGLYAWVGLDVNLRDMAIRNVQYRRMLDNGIPVLAIRGEIVNMAAEPQHVPTLRFALRDGGRHEIYSWVMPVAAEPLKPLAVTAFATRGASPPDEAAEVQIRFARAGEIGSEFRP